MSAGVVHVGSRRRVERRDAETRRKIRRGSQKGFRLTPIATLHPESVIPRGVLRPEGSRDGNTLSSRDPSEYLGMTGNGYRRCDACCAFLGPPRIFLCVSASLRSILFQPSRSSIVAATVRTVGGQCPLYTSHFQRPPRQSLVRFQVSPLRPLDHVSRQRRGGRGFVPRLGLQPVADELLVEARLVVAGLVTFGRPEAAAVGGQDFVDQYQRPVRQAAELELRVGDDDAPPARRSRPPRCRGASVRSRSSAAVSRPTRSAASSKPMLMSWPLSSLVAGVKIGSGSLSHCRRPAGSWTPQTVPRLAVFLPARPGEVAAGDALDRDDLGLAHQHRPPPHLVRERPQRRRVAVDVASRSGGSRIGWRTGRTRRGSGP